MKKYVGSRLNLAPMPLDIIDRCVCRCLISLNEYFSRINRYVISITIGKFPTNVLIQSLLPTYCNINNREKLNNSLKTQCQQRA